MIIKQYRYFVVFNRKKAASQRNAPAGFSVNFEGLTVKIPFPKNTQQKSPAKIIISRGLHLLAAVWTGLEPATSAVTGRHSNQLNYQTRCYRTMETGCKSKPFFDACKGEINFFFTSSCPC